MSLFWIFLEYNFISGRYFRTLKFFFSNFTLFQTNKLQTLNMTRTCSNDDPSTSNLIRQVTLTKSECMPRELFLQEHAGFQFRQFFFFFLLYSWNIKGQHGARYRITTIYHSITTVLVVLGKGGKDGREGGWSMILTGPGDSCWLREVVGLRIHNLPR